MTNRDQINLAKPLLIYDGSCPFCCRYAASLGKGAGDSVDIRPVQSGAGTKHGFGADAKLGAVTLIEHNEEVFTGAAAIFRLMSLSGSLYGMALWRLYRKVPFLRLIAGWGYRFIARIRHLLPASKNEC